MSNIQKFLTALCVVMVAALVAVAADTRPRHYDKAVTHLHTGTTDIDVSASDYTSFVALLTMEPVANTAARDVQIQLDLDKASTGINAVFAGKAELQFALQRKVDGTNWRTDIATITTLVGGGSTGADTPATGMIKLDAKHVTPTEDLRVVVLCDDEANGGDAEVPYQVLYTAPEVATFTDVAN